jgi:energy-coupling factor transporter ATP-binding protein EcfA2/nucleoside phosphorylase
MAHPKLPAVDIGIITMQDDELAAVLEHFPVKDVARGRSIYNLSRARAIEDDVYDVAVMRIPHRTRADAESATRNLLGDLRPQWLLVVGVGEAGPTAAFSPLDVVVSSWIHVFPPDAANEAHALAMNPEASAVVTNLVGFLSRIGGWSERSLKVVSQHVIATDELVAREELVKRWSSFPSQVTLAEIASAGVHRVAAERGVPCISIRGVSGRAHGKRTVADIMAETNEPAWEKAACHNAASFAHALIRSGALAVHTDGRSRHASPAHSAVALWAQPLHLHKLELARVRGIEQLSPTFTAPASTSGQWIVLLGDNGTGKTTILRSLALAVADDGEAHAALSRIPARMTRLGAPSARICLHGPNGTRFEREILATNGSEQLSGTTPPALPFVVAYGCRRGSALGGASREVRLTSGAIETLFDEGASIINAETWLKEWKLAEMQAKDPHDPAFFRAIEATLCKLLDLRHIEVTRDAVMVEGAAVGKVPLGALSDGYLTTAGWVLDMIARWTEEARRSGQPVGEDFAERMTGLALVDEIDLHLHPRWQRDIISTIRGLFPQMTFVVTTHNPLTLLGARPGEVHILRRDDETGGITIEQRDLPAGATAEQVLTGEWFGLASTRDDETMAMLEEHRLLLREKAPESPDVRALEEKLRQRIRGFADTSVERLAHTAAATVIDEDIRKLTPAKREEAVKKIADILRDPPPRARTTRQKAKSAARR